MPINSSAGVKPDQEDVVYIGPGVTLKGEFSISERLVVDGVIEGDVTAQAVIVGRTGAIRGKVTAAQADISGVVGDHIDIEDLLVVRSTGRVEGRVLYGEIELEKGAVLMGDLSANGDRRAAAKPAAQKQPAVQEPAGAVAPAPAAKAGSSIERLNDAVRAARSGAGKPVFATEKETLRRNILRAPLSSRRASA